MKEKRVVTLYGGDAVIEFNPANHGYRQIGYNLSRLPIPAFSGIADNIIPKPGLMKWYADSGPEYIYSNWREGMGKAEIANLCEEAKGAANRKRDAAGDSGTITHQFVEEVLKTGRGAFPTDPLAAKACAAFLDWFHTTPVKMIESERIGFSKHHWYCCTTDFYGRIFDELCVADFKTGSGVFYDEREVMQLAANAIAIEEDLETVKIDVGWIMHLDKNKGAFSSYRVELPQSVKDKWRRGVDWYRARNELKPIVKEIKGASNANHNDRGSVRQRAKTRKEARVG